MKTNILIILLLGAFYGTAQITSTSFESNDDFATGSNPWGHAIGDFDNDGKKDAVVSNHNSTNISVYRNIGTLDNITSCTFDTKIDYATAGGPRVVDLGDFDGDGKLDIAVVCYNGGVVSVFLNTSPGTGTISFASKMDFAVGSGPTGLIAADLDGDNKLDLAVANHLDDDISILRNTSPGTGTINFATKVDFPAATGPQEITAADLDGDNKKDLAVSNFGSASMSAFRNTSPGSGTVNFAIKADFPCGPSPVGLDAADFNGDGKKDIVVANNATTTVSVFENNGVSTGTITFATKVDYTLPAIGTDVIAADLDCDGDVDMAATSYASGTGTISAFRNTSSGSISFSSRVDFLTGDAVTTVVSGDIDGDGYSDLSTTNYNDSDFSVFRNTQCPTRSFSRKVDFSAGLYTWGCSAGDFDGDSKNDIVVSNNGNNSISVYRNLGECTGVGLCSYDSKIDYTTSGGPRVVDLGDFDGDGKLDIAVVCYAGGVVSLFLNTSPGTGTISFATKVDVSVGSGPPGLVVADFDGDNKPDIAAPNHLDNDVSVLLNTSPGTGTISFATKIDFPSASGPQEITAVDLDGDNKKDLAVSNFGSASMSAFLNTSPGSGTINFAGKVDFACGPSPVGIHFADFDGDNQQDIVIANNGTTTVSFFENTSPGTGTISFASKVDYSLPGIGTDVFAADLDGDGLPDLAATSTSGNNNVSIFRNISTGTPTFATRVDFASGNEPVSLFVGNVDCGSKKDVIATNYYGSSFSILRNTSVSGTISLRLIVSSEQKLLANESQNVSFSVYPNPSNGLAYLESNQSITNIVLRVLDIFGKTVFSEICNYDSTDSSLPINLQHLSSGVYFLNLQYNGNISNVKLIIE